MNLTKSETDMILDGITGVRDSVEMLRQETAMDFKRVHERIDGAFDRCDVHCIKQFATKEELAYVDGRVTGVNKEFSGSIGRCWRAVQLSATVIVVVGLAYMAEHKEMALEWIEHFWKRFG